MEIKTRRELAFYPGTAIGPRFPGYRYQDNTGEHVASISKPAPRHNTEQDSVSRKVYFNGGCYFCKTENNQLDDGVVLWEYKGSADTAPAVVGCRVGRGRVVLSGVHPEVGLQDVNNSLHLDNVISEMRLHDTDRNSVLDDIFMFLENGS